MIELFVTYRMDGGNPVTSVGRTDDPDDPQTFKVNVEYRPGMDQQALRMQAIALADPLFHAYLHAQLKARQASSGASQASVPAVMIQEEEERQLLFEPDQILPVIDLALQRVVAVTRRAVRFELTGHGTASTDCLSLVTINPEPALEGKFSAFYGRALHESSHIRYDREGTRRDKRRRFGEEAYGTAILKRAHADGGKILGHILNLIMDRRCDWLHAEEFPGNASDIWHRLGDLLPGEHEVFVPADGSDPVPMSELPNPLPEGQFKWVKRRSGVSRECDESVFTDFVYACKKHTKGRHACVRTAITMVNKATQRVNKGQRKYAHLLTVSKRVLKLLREHMTPKEAEWEQKQFDQEHFEQAFIELMGQLHKAIHGSSVDPRTRQAFRQLMANRMASQRQQSLKGLPAQMKATGRGSASLLPPGKVASGGDGEVIDVGPDPIAYASVLPMAQPHISPMRELIRQLSIPQRRSLQGLIEGDFDLNAIPALVTGRSECMAIERTNRKLDVALSFMIDVSASMSGKPMRQAKALGVCFNEALLPFRQTVEGFFFAFDDKVYRCGPVQPSNGLSSVKGGGGTCESIALRHAAIPLAKSRRRRKIIVVACDGMPFDPEETRKECDVLMRAGILPIRALIGVDQAPGTYPVELYFDTWEEFMREAKKTFGSIFAAARM